MADRRHDHPFHLGGFGVAAEHAGHRMAVDVGVEHADGEAALGEGGGQVHRDRRFADAALAGGDRVHPRQRSGLGERDDRLVLVAAELLTQGGALFVVHHVELDPHLTDAGYVGDGLRPG